MDNTIIYRSRGEQVFDQFWWDVAVPFIGQHWFPILCTLVAFVAAVAIYEPINDKYRRWKRRRSQRREYS
jgi:peptidoglycan/LPS O-acetylase OafA/YrhL